MMDEAKKKRLEEKGWKVGSIEEFLGTNAYEDTMTLLEEIVKDPETNSRDFVFASALLMLMRNNYYVRKDI